MYIYLSDSSGNPAGCCFVPDAAWPAVRGPMNTAVRAAGGSFIAQTEANSPSDVTATCTDGASATAWVQGGGSKFGYERGYFRCLRQPGRVTGGMDCESRCEFGEEVNRAGQGSRFGDECRPSGTIGDYAVYDGVFGCDPCGPTSPGFEFGPAGEMARGAQGAGVSSQYLDLTQASEFGADFGHAHGGGGHHGGGGGYGPGPGYWGGGYGAVLVAEEIPDYSWISEMRHGGVVSRG